MILMVRPLLRYADFKGRASRTEYWLFKLFQGLVYAGLGIFLILALTGSKRISEAIPFILLPVGFFLGCIIPNFAVMVRRLHDSGRSAWWLCLYLPGTLSFTRSVLGILQYLQAAKDAGDQMHFVSTGMGHVAAFTILGVLNFAGYITMTVLMAWRGTSGPNRFGADPKQPGSGAGAFDDMHMPAQSITPVHVRSSRPAPTRIPIYVDPPYTAPVSQQKSATKVGNTKPAFGKRQ